jgi:hypothetical protein
MNKQAHSKVLSGLIYLQFFLAGVSLCRAATDISPTLLTGSSLQVRSTEEDGLLGAEVNGMIEYPFSRVKEALTAPAAWCDFIPLVFNVKSCIHSVRNDRTLLTLFIGRKFFEPPEDALQLEYVFRILKQEEDQLRVLLIASEGPHGTRAYRIEVEAHADADGRTFIRLNSSFRPSLRSKFATGIYLSTTGSDKIGFSVVGKEGGKLLYVGGTKGIVERNAMRYYMALKAYLDTLHVPEENRLDARLNAWFDLTQEHPRQLYEMSKREYLSTKRKERGYQLELQGSTNQFQVNRNERRVHAVQG